MNETFLVSVIIPTHNRRHLLMRLLDSLAEQTLDPGDFEVIVVHNYTDDGTEEAVADWIRNAPFSLQYHRKNYDGPAASRQFGSEVSHGTVLAYIDDDCVPQPAWLQAGLARISEAEAAGEPVALVQGRTLPHPDQPRRFLEKTVSIPEPSIFFETCNIFYKRDAFLEVGGFSPEFLTRFYGEDTDLGWKTLEAGYSPQFAKDALVYHEVFHVSVWKWLKEPLFFRNLPYLARKFPAMRQHMVMRYFLTLETALFDLALLGIVTSIWAGPAGLLLTLPYFLQRFRSGAHVQSPLFRCMRVIAGIPRNSCMFYALVTGTLQYRSILL